ncbi:CotH kinase family protein [Dyadobacter sp. CY356]|uniref:CotH kinase family protein n=1 Tax=Dyadobacter sp. CY356 TaxID=2906442 RepID=UPI001F15BBC0|nr:CotH kinase family protein [Dyadobacter sp. CY356]MCF0057659.1 CotH kinase family protein [Dyadobacter sp. CY356]
MKFKFTPELQFYRCYILALAVVFFIATVTSAQPITSIIQSNIPIIIINPGNVEIPNDPKVTASFKIIGADGEGFYSYNRPSFTDIYQYEGQIGIEIRGNTSTEWPKKSYGFETRDAAGATIDVSLFGMPAESDWVLNACYGDKSFIREVLAQQMYRQTGRYAPRTQYVEVFLQTNGAMTYMGVYIFMEKVKRGADRVSIKKLSETDSDPAKITGGFLLQVGEDEPEKWTSGISPNNNPSNPKPIYHVEYPKLEKYTNATNKALQFNYIKGFVDNFEQALNGANFKDVATGYRKYLDVDSMVDYLLLQEFTKNSDNWRASTFFYKKRNDEGGLLNMGAPWDFDKSMGNQQWCYELSVLPTDSWAWKFNSYCPDRPPLTVSWPEKILNDCYFVQKLVTRYKQLRLTVWSDANVQSFVEAQSDVLKSKNAINRNFTKWQTLETGIMYNEHYSLAGNTPQKEVDYLKTWLQQHLAWMDSNIATITSTDCSTALPVTYKSFQANKEDDNVIITWVTTSESNNKRFEVQRSKDGLLFAKIGLVEGRGDSESEIKYQFIDSNPEIGINYYRLSQIDFSGSEELSRTIGVNFEKPATSPYLYPNPATKEINLKDVTPGSIITIMDSNGRVFIKTTSNNPELNLSVNNLSNQTYYLTIDDKTNIKSFTLIINH